MRSQQKYTNIDKRKLTYDRFDRLKAVNSLEPSKQAHPLDLPPEFEKKISSTEHKKLREAFFIEADKDLMLTKQKFPVAMRSLGIILNTYEFHKIFSELEKKYMNWREFLMAYVAKRGFKGSYNELSHAVYDLAKEYRGDWDELIEDLQTLGDVLSREEIEILKYDILKGTTISSESLINGLLYQK